MRRTLWTGAMLLTVLLPCGALWAQEPHPPGPPGTHGQPLYPPGYEPYPRPPLTPPPPGSFAPFPKTPPGANDLPPGHPPVDNSPSKTPVKDFFRYHRPLGCWSSFNGYGCSSLRSDVGFIFGSCRTFFGEPCLKGAPPSPVPPWAGNEAGYRRVGPQSSFDTPPARNGLRRWGAGGEKEGCTSCGRW